MDVRRKGYIGVAAEKHTEDEMMEVALDIGADDVKLEGDIFEVYTPFEEYANVMEELRNAITMSPNPKSPAYLRTRSRLKAIRRSHCLSFSTNSMRTTIYRATLPTPILTRRTIEEYVNS